MERGILVVALAVFTCQCMFIAGASGACTPTCASYQVCAEDKCKCPDGYEGVNCTTDIDDCAVTPCKNSGKCEDAVAGYSCTCEAGWTGTTCESKTEECDSNPCQNSGTCTQAVASYTCACAAGWTGTNCESESGASLSTASCLILALALALTKMATD